MRHGGICFWLGLARSNEVNFSPQMTSLQKKQVSTKAITMRMQNKSVCEHMCYDERLISIRFQYICKK